MSGHFGQPLHPRCCGDVVIEDVVDDGSHRFDAQNIDIREDIVNACQRLACLGKNVLDPSPDSRVPGVNHRHPQPGRGDDPRVLDHGPFLPVVDSAGQQDDVGVVLLQILEIELVHRPDGGHRDDGPGTQGCLAGSPGRHGLGQTVDAHAQPTGCRGVHEDLPGVQR